MSEKLEELNAALAFADKTRLLDDRVLVLKDVAQETTPSGLYIGQSEQQREFLIRGTIQKTGPGLYSEKTGTRIATQVQPGQRVLFNKFASHEVPGHKRLMLLKECEIHAILEE